MLVLFNVKEMKVGCPIMQAMSGGDLGAPGLFSPDDWQTSPTPELRMYEATDEQLQKLVKHCQARRQEEAE